MPQVNVKALGLRKRYRFEDPNVEWVRHGRINVGVACYNGQTFEAVLPLSRELTQLIEDEELTVLREYSVFATYDEVFENLVYKSFLTTCGVGERDVVLPLDNLCQQIIIHPATEDTRYSFSLIDRDGIIAHQRNNLRGEHNEHALHLPLTMTQTIRIDEATRDEEFFVKLKFERAFDMTKTGHVDRGYHTGHWRAFHTDDGK